MGFIGRPLGIEAILHQESTADALEVQRGTAVWTGQLDYAEVLLLPKHRQRVIVEARGHHDLDEQVGHRLRRRPVDHGVECDDGPERGSAVGSERPGIRVGRRRPQGNAARRRVLDDRAGHALGPRLHRGHGGIDVEQIVERQLFPMQLLQIPQPRLVGDVQGGALMRILPVAQRLRAVQHECESRRESVLALLREIRGDPRIVGSRVGEHLGREAAAPLGRRAAVRQLRQDAVVVLGIDDHDHRFVVLCGRAQHGRPADVDLLDRLREGHVRSADRLLERIKVDRDQIDRRDVVRRHGRDIPGMVAAGQKAAVHLGVQRFQAAIHNFGEPGDRLDRGDRDALAPQRVGGPTGRHDLPPQAGEPARERDDAPLVRHRQQRPHQSSATARTRSPRLTRSRRSITSTGEWE